jgi:hypothetical protein
MKKYLLLFILGVLVYSANAQNTTKQSNSLTDQDFLWAGISQHENVIIPKNPDAGKVEEINTTATCFCVASYDDLAGKDSRSGVCMDLTSIVNTTYSGLDPERYPNRVDCQSKCTIAAANLTSAEIQAIADCSCAAGKANGTELIAFAAVGTKKYLSAQSLKKLVSSPQVTSTTCNCPTGWAANMTNIDGGVTADGKCKKLVCGPISTGPFPADGTPLGNWGFTWGNALYAWGSTTNGGAAKCSTVIVSPKVCRLQ